MENGYSPSIIREGKTIKKILLFIMCFLLTLICGCTVTKQNTNETKQTETQLFQNHPEQTTQEEKKTTLSDKNSISCVAQVLNSDDNEKYALSIIDFILLSGLPINTIIQADIIGENEYSCRYLLQIIDSDNRCYIIGLEDNYDCIGIKENSKEGDWIFTVTK